MSNSPNNIEVLLEHGDFVRSLAKSLIFDENQVDDVVQQTWLAWMQNRPGQLDSTRGWLATVVRNLVYQRHRRDSRREKRERAAAPQEAVPSSAEIVERESMRREVVEAALALEPDLRDVIVLKYFENLSVREVATRLRIPERTAYSRLERGLDAMRRALDAGHGGNRRAWCLGLIPLAIPSKAAAAAGKAAALLAAGILVLAGAGIYLASSGEKPQSSGASVALESPKEPANLGVAPVASDEEPESPATDRASIPGITAMASLAGTVIDGSSHLPQPGAKLLLYGATRFDGVESLRELEQGLVRRETVTDRDGKYEFTRLEEGMYFLVAPAQDSYSLSWAGLVEIAQRYRKGVEPMEGRDVSEINGISSMLFLGKASCIHMGVKDRAEIEVSLRRGGVIEGSARSERGESVPEAEIWAIPSLAQIDLGFLGPVQKGDLLAFLERHLPPIFPRAHADKEGNFQIQGALGPCLLVGKAPSLDRAELSVAVSAGETRRVELEFAEKKTGWKVQGSVKGADGQPMAGVRVFLTQAFPGEIPEWSEDLFSYCGRPSMLTGKDGSFDFSSAHGLEISDWYKEDELPSDSVQVFAMAPGFGCSGSAAFRLSEGKTKTLQLTLYPTFVPEGVVLDRESGLPIEGVYLYIRFDPSGEGSLQDFRPLRYRLLSGEEGQFKAKEKVSGKLAIDALKSGYENGVVTWKIPENAGERFEIYLSKLPWIVGGKVLDASGNPSPNGLTFDLASGASVKSPFFAVFAFDRDPMPFFEKIKDNPAAEEIHYLRAMNMQAQYVRANDIEGGSFSLQIPRAWAGSGRAWVTLLATGQAPQVREFHSGDALVEFRVDFEAARKRVALVPIQALDSKGQVVTSLEVSAYRRGKNEKAGKLLTASDRSCIYSLADGGEFDFLLQAKGFGARTIGNRYVDSGSLHEALTVTLQSECVATGIVSSLDGSPDASGITVLALDSQNRSIAWVVTEDSGKFELRGLGDERYRILSIQQNRVAASGEVQGIPGREISVVLQPPSK